MLIELALLSGGAVGSVTGYLFGQRAGANSKLPSVIAKRRKRVNLKRLLKDIKSAALSTERQALLLDLDPELGKQQEAARVAATRRMRLSLAATGMAVVGAIYPVFAIAGGLAVLYLSRHVFTLIRNDFKRRHYISQNLAGALLVLSMIVSGHLILAAFMGVIGGFFARIVNQLEESSQRRLINVFAGHPEKVWILKDEVEIEVDFQSVQSGDLVVVTAGEIIPVDGVVKAGSGQVDQHRLTGESQPAEKVTDDDVMASTLLLAGRLTIEVKTAGNATVAAKIGRVLNNTQSYKDTLIIRGRKINDRFLPVRLGISALTLPLRGPHAALAVLWSDLGSTAGEVSPLTMLSYLQILSRRNILIKDGRVFELLGAVDTIVFDKTGTLTLEEPTLGNIRVVGDHPTDDILRYAAAAEYRQPHPIAKAILAKAQAAGLTVPEPDLGSYQVGYGIKVSVEGRVIRVGSARFLAGEGIAWPESLPDRPPTAQQEEHSLIYVGIDDQLAGILELEPTLRPEVRDLIPALKQRGCDLYIISGDHEAPTRRMADMLGIDHYAAGILPENKASLVQQLRDDGRFVCFIGDGINDAIALKTAQVSISVKGASSAATDSAQVIFMDGTLLQLLPLFQLADEFEGTMNRNLLSSFGLGALNVGGVYLLHFGVAASMALFYFGTVVALANTLWPLVKYQEDEVYPNDGKS